METNSGQTQIAYDYIRDKIMTGEIAPGQALTMLEISKQIGVSRTPVRDALRLLEGEGLVTIKPNIGATVRSISPDEFREHCSVRLALESYAAGEAARTRLESDLREMEAHLNLLKEHCEKIAAGKNTSTHARIRARHDICFHLAIVGATRNEVLKREVMRLCILNRFVAREMARSDWEGAPGDSEERVAETHRCFMAEHQAIFEAIRAKDVAAARARIENHIQRIIDAFDRTALFEHQKRLQVALRI